MLHNDALKKDRPLLGIVDTKSIKNVDTTEKKDYDGSKKVFGIKRHILVDILGLPYALLVTTANVTDRDDFPESRAAIFHRKDSCQWRLYRQQIV